jgi:Cof subfamily protein (haloacid dehalogenase superfamily)
VITIPPRVMIDPLPRLVVFDIDGTLLDSDRRVPERTVNTVTRIAPKVTFALASARAPIELVSILRQMPAGTLVIAYQGAWLGRWDGSTIARSHDIRMANAVARRVAAEGERLGLTLGWFEGDEWWVTAVDHAVERHVALTGLEPHVDPLVASRSTQPHKLQFIAPNPSLEPMLGDLAQSGPPDCAMHRSERDYLEVTSVGVDKSSGLELTAASIGVGMAATVAFGDGDNDVQMLRSAGYGIAMASGTAAARAAARWTTRSNDEDGIPFALEAVFGAATR